MTSTGYMAPKDRKELLKQELTGITHEYDDLILANGPPQKVYWAQNIWFDPEVIPFTSISDAAKKLRERQALWSFYPYTYSRRGELIKEKLPRFVPKKIAFPGDLPKTPLGAWTLLDANTLLAAARTSSPFSNGEVHFQESKVPPSRAYLKLWEAFLKIGKMPQKGDVCLEVGASPGSWTWVLQNLGAEVIAVDKAPLDPSIGALPHVTFMKKDAFSLLPGSIPEVDWVLSDVVAYPEKLLEWVKAWLSLRPKTHFIVTLKFQGEADYSIIKEFEKIAGSHIIHLFHNKHELTWTNV